MSDTKKKLVMAWFRQSLVGHIILFETIVGIPALVVGLGVNHLEGTLTPRLTLEIIIYVLVSMLILAVISRYILMGPLQKKFDKKP
jgi:hypothetical protein